MKYNYAKMVVDEMMTDIETIDRDSLAYCMMYAYLMYKASDEVDNQICE